MGVTRGGRHLGQGEERRGGQRTETAGAGPDWTYNRVPVTRDWDHVTQMTPRPFDGGGEG